MTWFTAQQYVEPVAVDSVDVVAFVAVVAGFVVVVRKVDSVIVVGFVVFVEVVDSVVVFGFVVVVLRTEKQFIL